MRWGPAVGTVPGSLPVLCFGNLPQARVATVGINPSLQEYLTPARLELDGSERRFETLRSLGAPDRASLTDTHCERAFERMTRYFEPGRPVYRWFAGLARVMGGFGEPFQTGHAAHLDLIQEATDPTWSGLAKMDAGAAAALLARDLEFLRWQIGAFPLRAVICTSALVQRHVSTLTKARVVKQGVLERLRWTVAVGEIGGRSLPVVGWNLPLNRPTGLTSSQHVEFGAILAREVGGLTA